MCQITVADQVAPTGSQLFRSVYPRRCGNTASARDTRTRPKRAARRSQQCSVGTKLWPNFRYLQRRRVALGRICFIHHVAIETQQHHPALLSKISECASLHSTFAPYVHAAGFSPPPSLLHAQIYLLKHGRHNWKRKAYRKELKFYINICVYEMTKML